MKNKAKLIGVWYTLGAYLIWGFLPIYWKALAAVPPIQILSHRIFWSFVFILLIVVFKRVGGVFRQAFNSSKNRVVCSITAAIIGVNWFIYIWAMVNDHIIDASLGYFINPLVSILLGVVILKEKLTRQQVLAVILAFMGVGYLTIQYGRIPWIALSLAFTFGIYALLRKTAQVESIIGFTAEAALLAPVVLSLIVIFQFKGVGVVGKVSPLLHLLLLGSGIFTAGPLVLFTSGVRKIPLSTAGFIQYIAPSIQLILGIFLYKETFTSGHLVSFIFIWAALIIYSFSLVESVRLHNS